MKNDFFKDHMYIFASIYRWDIHDAKKISENKVADVSGLMLVNFLYLKSINSKVGSFTKLKALALNYDPDRGMMALRYLTCCGVIKLIKGSDLYYCMTYQNRISEEELQRLKREVISSKRDLQVDVSGIRFGDFEIENSELWRSNIQKTLEWIGNTVDRELPKFVLKKANLYEKKHSKFHAVKCLSLLRFYLETSHNLIGFKKYTDSIGAVMGMSDKKFKSFIKKTHVLQYDDKRGIIFDGYIRHKLNLTTAPDDEEVKRAKVLCDTDFINAIRSKLINNHEE